jgi:hypothetical protein
MTEKEIQKYIWDNKENFRDFFPPPWVHRLVLRRSLVFNQLRMLQ